ncbi:MAG: PTS fructose transporter subunit IIA [Candidatus Aminicenantes bacterium]|nr:MAG: PTS fructose transporter subunit IIA [Candidatus Aminicenantes bacterium]
MIKAFIITHGNLGKELIAVAEEILETKSEIDCICFDWKEDGSKSLHKIEDYLKKHEGKGNNIIIFTDMFGGAPTNICFKFHKKNIEIITGINLPGLLKFLTYRDKKMSFKALVKEIKKGAVDGINIIGEYLGEKKS